MKTIDDFAHKTLQVAYKDEPPQIFIELIMIIAIIVNIIGIIQRCKEKDVPSRVKNHKLSDKRILKRIMKKHLTKEQYQSESKKLTSALLQIGEDSDPEEIQKAYEEGINASI